MRASDKSVAEQAGRPRRLRRPRVPSMTRDMAMAELRRRLAAGRAMNRTAVFREQSGLHHACIRLFGSWDGCLRLLGLDPRDVRLKAPRSHWTRATLRAAIAARRRRGLAMNLRAVHKSQRTLTDAAQRLYGSWDASLRAAGVDPARVRLLRTPWKEKEVIAALRRRYRDGKSMRRKDVPLALVGGALKFGTWVRMLVRAGVPLEAAGRWTRERVIQLIRRRAKRRLPLNRKAVWQSRDWNVSRWAVKLFGSWDEGLKAAGLDPDRIRGLRILTDAGVFKQLRKQHALRLPMDRTAVQRRDPSLANKIRARWGSNGWDRALRLAGVPAARSARRSLPGEAERGGSLREAFLALGCHTAAEWHFGSWHAALRAAGIDASTVKYKRR